jgi:hypothetical protein
MKTRPGGRFTDKQKFIIDFIKKENRPVTQTEVAIKYGEKIHKGKDVPESYKLAAAVCLTFNKLIEKGLIEKDSNGKFTI